MGPGTGLAGWTGKTEVAFDSVMTTELMKTHVKHPLLGGGSTKSSRKEAFGLAQFLNCKRL